MVVNGATGYVILLSMEKNSHKLKEIQEWLKRNDCPCNGAYHEKIIL